MQATAPHQSLAAFEALVAILYLERGFAYAQKFVVRCLEKDIERYRSIVSRLGLRR